MVSESLGISMFTDMMMGKIVGRGEDGRIREHFQPFLRCPENKKRGTDRPHRASLEIMGKPCYSASFLMVGTRPMFGLPTGPCAVTLLR
jgi:hypothetical protein